MDFGYAFLDSRYCRRVSSESLALIDPIGTHLIQLREYYRTMEEKIEERKELLSKHEKMPKRRRVQNFPVPKFPPHYPFSQSLKPQPKKKTRSRSMQFMDDGSKESRKTFIRRVLLQTGFIITGLPEEFNAIEFLSGLLDEFLRKIVNRLQYYKGDEPFKEDQDLMGPLETTLRHFGIGGISALHTFYYENVVKKHDILYKKCLDLNAEYKEIMKKP